MAENKVDKAAQLAKLPVRPDEDPFIVAIGGFYRRWFNLVDDLQPMIDTVAKLKGTEDEDWVPAWCAVAEPYEKEAEAALKRGDKAAARNLFLQAKTYYSLARFPAPYHSGSPICPPNMSPLKERSRTRSTSNASGARPSCVTRRRKSFASRATAGKPSAICARRKARPHPTAFPRCW